MIVINTIHKKELHLMSHQRQSHEILPDLSNNVVHNVSP